MWDDIRNPLILLLVALGVLSYATGDLRATVVIFVMVLLGVVLRFFQELRADNAAARLKAMVGSTATVIRGGIEVERPLRSLVPGDIIALAAGDMVPADVRVLAGKDLFLNQAALTGEAMPVERKAAPAPAAGGTRSTCRTCASWVRTWKAARPRPWSCSRAAAPTSARWPPASAASASVPLTMSPLADTLGFVPLPALYWLLLAIMLPCYVVLTQVVKTWFHRRFGD